MGRRLPFVDDREPGGTGAICHRPDAAVGNAVGVQMSRRQIGVLGDTYGLQLSPPVLLTPPGKEAPCIIKPLSSSRLPHWLEGRRCPPLLFARCTAKFPLLHKGIQGRDDGERQDC